MIERQKISVDINKKHYIKLKEIAEEKDIKLTDIIRTLIKIYLE